MTFTIPPPLELGDTVALVAPSFGAAGAWPHRAERGEAYLRSLGLEVKWMPHARRNDSWVSAPAEDRAGDLHSAFADPEVKLVLAVIGGNHSNELPPLLDFDLIRAHPKWFQGYSDATVLHYALLRHAGLATFYGPALTLEPAEFPAVFPYTDASLRAAWFREPVTNIAAEVWTEELLDFDEQLDLTRARHTQPSEGWVTVRPGVTEGPLIGGCLETICWHLTGSTEWFMPEGAIFFVETSEEVPSVAHVDAYLTDLERLGVFERAAGLVAGRPRGYTQDARSDLWQLLERRTERYGFPVLGNVDCSHTDPMLTLPLGVPARLDATERTITPRW